ncbi:MAG: hypothetical protein ABIQ90_14425 [Polaromonas sp.]
MTIISFSNAATPSFWALPVQPLAPWLTRFKISFSPMPAVSTAQRTAASLPSALAPENTRASNDSRFAIGPEPVTGTQPCKTASKSSTRRSLRVVREFDSAIAPDCAGRMVISGRMADVCAELDRMVLRETLARSLTH